MNNTLDDLFNKHIEWLETEGENGEQLVLESIISNKLTIEQLRLLTDSILTECTFAEVELKKIDLYHTEMYSCIFANVSFSETQLTKSEINDTKFTNTSFETTSFSNSEIFDCNFTKCAFISSTFVSIGIWNTIFINCIFDNINFDNAYIENVIFSDSTFSNPFNLDKATKIILNIGTIQNPILLSHEESIKWIKERKHNSQRTACSFAGTV